MMIQTMSSRCSLSTCIIDFNHGLKPTSPSRSVSSSVPRICCSTSRSDAYIPKLEPFSRTKIDRAVKEPPLIEKSENQIADYCLTLEGDDSYDCWRAYFELKDLEKDAPKEELERLIIEAGGVKSLIGCIHGVSSIHKAKKEEQIETQKQANLEKTSQNQCPIPDGLPKTREEIEEEEKAKMPDSPFTRLLRARGRHPAWYSPAPEHEYN